MATARTDDGGSRLDSVRGAVSLERSVFSGGRGLVGLRHSFTAVGRHTRVLVTGEAWILSSGIVEHGRVRVGGVEAPAFTMLFPPRSLVRLELDAARFTCMGVGGFGAPPRRAALPTLLDPPRVQPNSVSALMALAAGEALGVLDPDRGVDGPVRAARASLHDRLSSPRPVSAAAAAVGMPAYALCRAFGLAYGLTPKQYVHRARLFDATLRLLLGVTVIEAALGSGFSDLTRFYCQFRRVVGATPALYRRAVQETPRPPA
jgi:AraC-like DNA-binding protein